MSWYKEFKKNDEELFSKEHLQTDVSKKGEEHIVYFNAYRKHETSYYVMIVKRQIDNNNNDPYWVTSASAYSIESGNVVYRKNEFFKKEADSTKAFEEIKRRVDKLQHNFGASSTPTSTLASMIWHLLHDITGDHDLNAKGKHNIIYLRQDHNINENRGNLLNNIIYLKEADYHFLDKRQSRKDEAQYF